MTAAAEEALPGYHPATRAHLDAIVWGLAALCLGLPFELWFLTFVVLAAWVRAAENRYWARHGR